MQTQPAEDIEAVLGRFQAWSGLQHAAEVRPGIRELSYEEALESNRYRWGASGNEAAKKNAESQSRLREEPGAVRMAVPVTAIEVKAEKAATMKSRKANRRDTAKKDRGKYPAAKTTQDETARRTASKVMRKTGHKATTPQPFKEVLAEAVRPAAAIVQAQPVELSRQVAVSIRLAPAERALIKTRATEAGLTVSAYIRQCALEVEQLRAQVQQTLAELGKRAAMPSVTDESQGAQPGFLARLMRRFLSTPGSRLALRA